MLDMISPELQAAMESAAHTMLEWIGFGTLVGLSSKFLMPGRDPGGAFVTLVMGISGCVFGCAVAMYSFDMPRINPISWIGFAASTAGGFVLLGLYRLMSGRIIREGQDPDFVQMPRRRRRRRRQAA
jgi:uncharacterized membrane protein YeaQ/YmgE (transglycosylase-associated protein family)